MLCVMLLQRLWQSGQTSLYVRATTSFAPYRRLHLQPHCSLLHRPRHVNAMLYCCVFCFWQCCGSVHWPPHSCWNDFQLPLRADSPWWQLHHSLQHHCSWWRRTFRLHYCRMLLAGLGDENMWCVKGLLLLLLFVAPATVSSTC